MPTDRNFIAGKTSPINLAWNFKLPLKRLRAVRPPGACPNFEARPVVNCTSRLIKIWSWSILTDARPRIAVQWLCCEWLLFEKGCRGYGGLLNRAALSWQRATERQTRRGRQRERERMNDRTQEETRDRRRSRTKTSDRQETKDSTRQIKRDASRQEVGGEVGPTGRIALWGGFGAWIPSLYGRGNGYSTIACNPISTDAIYPIYHTLLSGALSTPAGGRSIA